MTRDRDIRRRRRRRMNNICQECEASALKGRPYCKKHDDIKRARSKRSMDRRRREGLCLGCGRPRLEFDVLMGVTNCSFCRETKSISKQRRVV